MLLISQRMSSCGIPTHSSKRACLSSWTVVDWNCSLKHVPDMFNWDKVWRPCIPTHVWFRKILKIRIGQSSSVIWQSSFWLSSIKTNVWARCTSTSTSNTSLTYRWAVRVPLSTFNVHATWYLGHCRYAWRWLCVIGTRIADRQALVWISFRMVCVKPVPLLHSGPHFGGLWSS